MRLAYTASDAYVPAMVAKDKGLFDKRGLDVELQIIALNSTMPAALHSGSLEIAGTTTPVFLQAIDGGIDLVGIAGGNVAEKANTRFAAVARKGIAIKTAEDFIGKKVGAPGLGANTHVLFRNWLLAKGVDYKRVNFVEVSFPQMNDVLKGGTVDAVLVSDPMLYRILEAGTGTVVVPFMEVLPVEMPIITFSAERAWANSHPGEVKAFYEAMAEAVKMIEADPEVARAAEAERIKLPPEIIKSVPVPRYKAYISDEGLQAWVDLMAKQDMLTKPIDVSKLMAR